MTASFLPLSVVGIIRYFKEKKRCEPSREDSDYILSIGHISIEQHLNYHKNPYKILGGIQR